MIEIKDIIKDLTDPTLKNTIKNFAESNDISISDMKEESLSKEKNLLLSNQIIIHSKKHFNTPYLFLNETKALAQKNFNLIVGRTGKGKTDLMVSIVSHNLLSGLTVAIFLSEGEISDFKRQLQEILGKETKLLSKIAIFNEEKVGLNQIGDPSIWNNKVLNILRDYSPDIFYFDNLSTIKFTNSNPEIEAYFIKDLVGKVRSQDICITALIHPSKSCHPMYGIGEESIRGNSAHVNLASNIFAFNNFINLDKTLRIITVLKSRDFGEVANRSYQLKFKKLKFRGFYPKDQKITEIEAKRYFAQNNRQKLSGLN